jgi:hypothetical protein
MLQVLHFVANQTWKSLEAVKQIRFFEVSVIRKLIFKAYVYLPKRIDDDRFFYSELVKDIYFGIPTVWGLWYNFTNIFATNGRNNDDLTKSAALSESSNHNIAFKKPPISS